MSLTMYLGVGTNTLLAEIMSDSTVLDNLSINGLLAEIAHIFYLRQFLHSKVNIKQKISTDNRVYLQSVLIFLCVSDIEFILCVGYFFCPYPHRSKAFYILVSVQSAFNIDTDIFVVYISGYWIVPTFGGCFIKI